MTKTQAKFDPGSLYLTPGARDALTHEELMLALSRHVQGDWGDCCPEDQQRNNEALMDGCRIFSVYHTADGTKFWIITEAVGDDGRRAATTALLPDEY
jgi:hypothetical protein